MNQIDSLVKALLKNENYLPIQKETILKSPLIDWEWVLLFLISALGIEWFVRKYNGLL